MIQKLDSKKPLMNTCKIGSLSLLTISLQFIFSASSADIIKCTFTEPFYSTEYSMVHQSLKISGANITAKTVPNVSFQIRSPAIFEIVNANKMVIQRLYLNSVGTDGMSPYIYPFKVKWLNHATDNNGGIGGCESNYLKKHQ